MDDSNDNAGVFNARSRLDRHVTFLALVTNGSEAQLDADSCLRKMLCPSSLPSMEPDSLRSTPVLDTSAASLCPLERSLAFSIDDFYSLSRSQLHKLGSWKLGSESTSNRNDLESVLAIALQYRRFAERLSASPNRREPGSAMALVGALRRLILDADCIFKCRRASDVRRFDPDAISATSEQMRFALHLDLLYVSLEAVCILDRGQLTKSDVSICSLKPTIEPHATQLCRVIIWNLLRVSAMRCKNMTFYEQRHTLPLGALGCCMWSLLARFVHECADKIGKDMNALVFDFVKLCCRRSAAHAVQLSDPTQFNFDPADLLHGLGSDGSAYFLLWFITKLYTSSSKAVRNASFFDSLQSIVASLVPQLLKRATTLPKMSADNGPLHHVLICTSACLYDCWRQTGAKSVLSLLTQFMVQRTNGEAQTLLDDLTTGQHTMHDYLVGPAVGQREPPLAVAVAAVGRAQSANAFVRTHHEDPIRHLIARLDEQSDLDIYLDLLTMALHADIGIYQSLKGRLAPLMPVNVRPPEGKSAEILIAICAAMLLDESQSVQWPRQPPPIAAKFLDSICADLLGSPIQRADLPNLHRCWHFVFALCFICVKTRVSFTRPASALSTSLSQLLHLGDAPAGSSAAVGGSNSVEACLVRDYLAWTNQLAECVLAVPENARHSLTSGLFDLMGSGFDRLSKSAMLHKHDSVYSLLPRFLDSLSTLLRSFCSARKSDVPTDELQQMVESRFWAVYGEIKKLSQVSASAEVARSIAALVQLYLNMTIRREVATATADKHVSRIGEPFGRIIDYFIASDLMNAIVVAHVLVAVFTESSVNKTTTLSALCPQRPIAEPESERPPQQRHAPGGPTDRPDMLTTMRLKVLRAWMRVNLELAADMALLGRLNSCVAPLYRQLFFDGMPTACRQHLSTSSSGNPSAAVGDLFRDIGAAYTDRSVNRDLLERRCGVLFADLSSIVCRSLERNKPIRPSSSDALDGSNSGIASITTSMGLVFRHCWFLFVGSGGNAARNQQSTGGRLLQSLSTYLLAGRNDSIERHLHDCEGVLAHYLMGLCSAYSWAKLQRSATTTTQVETLLRDVISRHIRREVDSGVPGVFTDASSQSVDSQTTRRTRNSRLAEFLQELRRQSEDTLSTTTISVEPARQFVLSLLATRFLKMPTSTGAIATGGHKAHWLAARHVLCTLVPSTIDCGGGRGRKRRAPSDSEDTSVSVVPLAAERTVSDLVILLPALLRLTFRSALARADGGSVEANAVRALARPMLKTLLTRVGTEMRAAQVARVESANYIHALRPILAAFTAETMRTEQVRVVAAIQLLVATGLGDLVVALKPDVDKQLAALDDAGLQSEAVILRCQLEPCFVSAESPR